MTHAPCSREGLKLGVDHQRKRLPVFNRCVPKTSSGSCDQPIFVDQAADAGVSSDAVLFKIDRFG